MFGDNNPYSSKLYLNSSLLRWVEKVKYLGTNTVSISCSQRSDLSSNIRKFYGQINILSVGKYSHELATLLLVKSYCLPTLLYGCETETWSFIEKELRKASVTWKLEHRMFSCCWRECVKPLHYYCQSLPLSYITNERRLLFWRKISIRDNIVLAVLSRGIVSKFVAVGSLWGISTWTLSVAKIKLQIWTTFVNSFTL